MKNPTTIFLCLVLALLVLALSHQASRVESSHSVGLKTAPADILVHRVTESIGPPFQNWLHRKLLSGKPVVLSNSYLFQVMKGISQENQKAAEEGLLIPLLKMTLKGLFRASSHPDTRRLFGVPLLLLDNEPALALPKKIVDQAKEIERSPFFKPRGHYTDSDELKRYFVAMQYLSKATIDVSIKPESFPFPRAMLFPFETLQAVLRIFGDPDNQALRRHWMAIHSFYSHVNGPSDLPTFAAVIERFQGRAVTRKGIEDWALPRYQPSINPERGLGIQPFGERVSLHQGVIDEFKQKLFTDDTPRETIAEALRFRNLLTGSNHENPRIKGLAQRIEGAKSQDYYSAALQAIGWGASGWEENLSRVNMFAGSLTSLAEQTALMTKTSILVQKSRPTVAEIPAGLRLYFEPDAERYLLALAEASDQMIRVCRQVRDASPGTRSVKVSFRDAADAFRAFAEHARNSKPLVTQSTLWTSYGHLLTELARNPAVAVDVFHLQDRSGNKYFYTWAIAPFEAAYTTGTSMPEASAMEMVFFEGWSDEMVPDSRGPLNNLQWQGRILAGGLDKLHSIIRLPSQRRAHR